MEKRKLTIRVLVAMMLLFGWWGFWYPQLGMPEGTYAVVTCDSNTASKEKKTEWDFDGDIYREILDAEPGRIQICSKLLEKLKRAVRT